MNSIGAVKNKNILFLQGPMGLFFRKIKKSFDRKGANTYKIGFNMGDQFFASSHNYIPYIDTPQNWESFIKVFLIEKKIDKIFLFGDCRFYQSVARKVAYALKINVFVFEEGYLRPHYITLEKFGVNGFSQVPKIANFYKKLPKKSISAPKHAQKSKVDVIISATLYYAIANLFIKKYPHYLHHRDFAAVQEFFYGVRDLFRKGLYYIIEKKYLSQITDKLSKKYYFVPLQTHNDFQILEHSNYRSIEKFILEVLESFANYAPIDRYIIFKHHPVDRGRKNYKSFIREQALLLNIEDRVLAIHDVHLPTCLNNACATITINSTVGLSSIEHGIPTITLGDAIYDIKGLTNRDKKLDSFWTTYYKPKDELYKKFKQYLILTTQLNGSFYGIMPNELK